MDATASRPPDLRYSKLHFIPEFADWVERNTYSDRLTEAFAEFDVACDNVPIEWWSVDNGVPTSFNRDAVREFLRRFMDNDFWGIA